MNDYEKYSAIFKAISDEKRLMIIDMLSCGELCACKILEHFKMSQSTLSHHMKQLTNANIVVPTTKGKWTYYSLNNETFEQMAKFLNFVSKAKENCSCFEQSNCEGGKQDEN